mmetsp:Transcript_26045/g.51096  ORF Transcript_26045/g.51096 Transcript_26045/m.51096 type:complete len:182 (+) Transcript_26045:180-725(+)
MQGGGQTNKQTKRARRQNTTDRSIETEPPAGKKMKENPQIYRRPSMIEAGQKKGRKRQRKERRKKSQKDGQTCRKTADPTNTQMKEKCHMNESAHRDELRSCSVRRKTEVPRQRDSSSLSLPISFSHRGPRHPFACLQGPQGPRSFQCFRGPHSLRVLRCAHRSAHLCPVPDLCVSHHILK